MFFSVSRSTPSCKPTSSNVPTSSSERPGVFEALGAASRNSPSATPCESASNGPSIRASASVGPATTRTTRMGLSTASSFGTSSPTVTSNTTMIAIVPSAAADVACRCASHQNISAVATVFTIVLPSRIVESNRHGVASNSATTAPSAGDCSASRRVWIFPSEKSAVSVLEKNADSASSTASASNGMSHSIIGFARSPSPRP